MSKITITDRVCLGEDGLYRCYWCVGSALYEKYHDLEWGHRPADDFALFKSISLEIFQSGLSWLTVLKKHDAFLKAFDGFDFYKISNYNQRKIDALLSMPSIIRHEGKIKSVIHNAGRAVEMCKQFPSLVDWIWQFRLPCIAMAGTKVVPMGHIEDVRRAADLLAALKFNGWKFIGLKNIYAFMQAIGLINAHMPSCFCLSDRAKYYE